jgi:hypothetical protein
MRTAATSAHDREVFEDHFGVTLVERQADEGCTSVLPSACDPAAVPALPRQLGKLVDVMIWREGTVHSCTVLVVTQGWVATCLDDRGEAFELTTRAGAGAEAQR